jgi:hypothetical protein
MALVARQRQEQIKTIYRAAQNEFGQQNRKPEPHRQTTKQELANDHPGHDERLA